MDSVSPIKSRRISLFPLTLCIKLYFLSQQRGLKPVLPLSPVPTQLGQPELLLWWTCYVQILGRGPHPRCPSSALADSVSCPLPPLCLDLRVKPLFFLIVPSSLILGWNSYQSSLASLPPASIGEVNGHMPPMSPGIPWALAAVWTWTLAGYLISQIRWVSSSVQQIFQ